jgi:hypothetical protein
MLRVLLFPLSSLSILSAPEAIGTAGIIAIALSNYNAALADVTLYDSLSAALTAQLLLTAVKNALLVPKRP